ncbi:MAG: hypothetical protein ACI4RA_05580 [Kiritimatiellia bacterium]
MKKSLVALAAALALAGCTSSTRIEWGGRTALRNPDGSVLLDASGAPHYETAPNIYRDANWLTRREERDVSVSVNADGSYSAGIGARVNDVSTNGVAIVTGGLDATTRLVSTVAAAYASISGGAASAATVVDVARSVYRAFASAGGDPAKATVSAGGGSLAVSDGSVCTECDAAGNCTAGACRE